MNCRKLIGLVADYLDGTLMLRQQEAIKTHLVRCEDCRAYLDSYKTTIELCRSLRHESNTKIHIGMPMGFARAIDRKCMSKKQML